jgi:hypothetical protein
MLSIGMAPHVGFFTKTEMRRGKIPAQGHKGEVGTQSSSSTGGNDVKEYVSVKIAAGTYISGQVVVIDGDGVATLGTTAPDNLVGGRVGVLCLKSTTVTTVAAATLTAVGTCFAWAQVYGKGLAKTSVSVTPNQALTLGADGTLQVAASASGSASTLGIHAIVTGGVGQLASVFLHYPQFSPAGAS